MADKNQHDTKYWLEQLSKVQLPVLSQVMQDLNAVEQSDAGSAKQLSDIILRDAALTSKVLRIANSAYHNPNTDNAIKTISRAVVQLGFTGIKAISLSVMMIDSLLKTQAKNRMLEWMARGFHAAIQAENLMNKSSKSDSNEQVFITALLLHIGDMAFWSTQGKYTDLLDKKLPAKSGSDAQLEKDVLGSTLKDISIALVSEWQLGDELLQALSPGNNPCQTTQAVLLGEEISLATEKGWDSQEFRDVLVKAAFFSGLSLEEARQLLMGSADKAAAVAVSYGAVVVCDYMPNAKAPNVEVAQSTLGVDPQLQLDVLREMAIMVEQNVDVNTLFTMVTEGIHRGIGLERVALCLIDPRAHSMKAKYVLGDNTQDWQEELGFPVKSEQDNVFAYCLYSRTSVWLRRKQDHAFEYLINKKMRRLIDMKNCLVSCVYTSNRPIGILIADRGKGGGDISNDQQESFEHFAQQTSVSLSMLAAQRARA